MEFKFTLNPAVFWHFKCLVKNISLIRRSRATEACFVFHNFSFASLLDLLISSQEGLLHFTSDTNGENVLFYFY